MILFVPAGLLVKAQGVHEGQDRLIGVLGNDQSQAENPISDLALSRMERATGIEPA